MGQIASLARRVTVQVARQLSLGKGPKSGWGQLRSKRARLLVGSL